MAPSTLQGHLTALSLQKLCCVSRYSVAECRFIGVDQGNDATPAVYSPATNAVLAAVMTGSAWGKSAHHQQVFTGAEAVPNDSARPEGLGEQTMGFIKTVPMQHVQTHYLESKQNGGKASVSCGALPMFASDSPVERISQLQCKMQPFAQLLRISSDSDSSND